VIRPARPTPAGWFALSPASVPIPSALADLPANADVCIVGAGVMGAWTAFWARAGGAGPDEDWGGGRSVTLLDGWGAGHVRATSSDEHRIIRSAQGEDRFRLGPRVAQRGPHLSSDTMAEAWPLF